MADLVTVVPVDEGAFWRVTMGGKKGNILDTALMDALVGVFDEAKRTPALRAIVLEGAGSHFSFGASVEEHLPDQVATMLTRFGSLMYAVVESGVVLLGAVRGQWDLDRERFSLGGLLLMRAELEVLAEICDLDSIHLFLRGQGVGRTPGEQRLLHGTLKSCYRITIAGEDGRAAIRAA